MHIVSSSPKKSKWLLTKHVDDDAHARILTGYVGYHTAGWVTNGRLEEIGNIVCTMSLKLIGSGRGRSSVVFEFQDKDTMDRKTPDVYLVSQSGMTDIVVKLQEERLSLDGGYITGQFTFVKQGECIYLVAA